MYIVHVCPFLSLFFLKLLFVSLIVVCLFVSLFVVCLCFCSYTCTCIFVVRLFVSLSLYMYVCLQVLVPLFTFMSAFCLFPLLVLIRTMITGWGRPATELWKSVQRRSRSAWLLISRPCLAAGLLGCVIPMDPVHLQHGPPLMLPSLLRNRRRFSGLDWRPSFQWANHPNKPSYIIIHVHVHVIHCI